MLIPHEEADSDGNRSMTAKFMARSFPQIPDKELILEDGVHKLLAESIVKPSASEIDELKTFIREYVPENAETALPTRELLKLMDAEWCERPWRMETIKRRKLSEWVETGYLRVIGQKPKRYYQGSCV